MFAYSERLDKIVIMDILISYGNAIIATNATLILASSGYREQGLH